MPGQEWKVYLLKCRDDSIYCGVTTDLQRRLSEHNSGKGAKYTRSRRPCEVVACWIVSDRSFAQKVEYRIKSMSRSEKLLLIGGGDIVLLAGLEPQKCVPVRVPDGYFLTYGNGLSGPNLN